MPEGMAGGQASKGKLMTVFSLPVIVAALGYFVDIYDLVLFSIVRVPSLKGSGPAGQELIDKGVLLLNMQMVGMLLGGVLWGVLGDRKGRLKIMFGSIFLYSVANLANGLVTSIDGLCRSPLHRRRRPGRRTGRRHHPGQRSAAQEPARLRHHDRRVGRRLRGDPGQLCRRDL